MFFQLQNFIKQKQSIRKTLFEIFKNKKDSYHPLSINLTTKAVWCEICSNKILLEQNDPAYCLKHKSKQQQKQTDLNALISNQFSKIVEKYVKKEQFDDMELISYLDKECNKEDQYSKVF